VHRSSGRAKSARHQDDTSERVVVTLSGAGLAQGLPLAPHFPPKIDSLAALLAGDSFSLVSGKFFRREIDFHPLCCEQVVIRHFAVGEHLLLILVFDFGMELAGERFRGLFRCDADSFARVHIDERGGHLAPVAELQSTLAEAASGDDGDGVGGAAVDFDEGDEALAIFAMRIADVEFLQAEHRKAHAENLTSTDVAVCLFGVAEIFVEGFQEQASGFSLTL